MHFLKVGNTYINEATIAVVHVDAKTGHGSLDRYGNKIIGLDDGPGVHLYLTGGQVLRFIGHKADCLRDYVARLNAKEVSRDQFEPSLPHERT